MKCPKCGYLGFETTERCRNCGYDFSLSVTVESSSELPLRSAVQPEGVLADFDLSGLDTKVGLDSATGLDLDRLIGTSTAVATPPSEEVQEQYHHPAPVPRPALPPLAVRRTTPEIARRRTPRTLRREDAELPFQIDGAASGPDAAAPAESGLTTAPRVARVAAALVDTAILAAINMAVLYLTLAIAGLSFGDVRVLPPVPMATFLLLLNAGYLTTFTAAGGQTIGKMIVHLRVIGDDGGRVDVPGAIFRTAGVALSFLAIGLPYLPALMTSHGRALHDRLAGTRVVKIA